MCTFSQVYFRCLKNGKTGLLFTDFVWKSQCSVVSFLQLKYKHFTKRYTIL